MKKYVKSDPDPKWPKVTRVTQIGVTPSDPKLLILLGPLLLGHFLDVKMGENDIGHLPTAFLFG